MKLLLFQAKAFAWRSFQKTLPEAPDLDVDESAEEALVVFLHAEEADPDKPKLETKVVKYIKWLAGKRGLKDVVLHSFSHLSTSTAPAEFAGAFLQGLGERLRNTGYSVQQTPFGYVCTWDLSVHGESMAKVFAEF
ncbi:MAG: threonyl-tRNA synthetase editing domain-containing protein [Acidobacteriota bacterium]|nr:threonyl-tRNA synthetase editing domain-containing protein [Acidobacteriota bacterium]